MQGSHTHEPDPTRTRYICKKIQRRSHRKSRNGCSNCKRRKVKCDENRPSCDRCSRSSILCDFDLATPEATKPSNLLLKNTTAPKRRGRPLKKWTTCSLDGSAGNSEHRNTGPRLPKLQPPGHESHALNVEDMHLFFHYMNRTCLTFGDDALWRDRVPILAFENPYVLHLLLAISALHITRLPRIPSDEVAKYEQLAEDHFAVALPQVTALLPEITSENCSALYIATVLVCNYSFAKPPADGHLLVVADNNEVSWWTLFRGVRFVVEKFTLEAIFSNHLGPLARENKTKIPPPPGQSGYIPWEAYLERLITLTSAHPHSVGGLMETLCQGLVDCFREVFGTSAEPRAITHGKTHVVIRWLWILDDEFADEIKRRNPVAMLLLAYFTVILQTLDCYWFMKGWAVHVLSGIENRLDSAFSEWISWPKQQLRL